MNRRGSSPAALVTWTAAALATGLGVWALVWLPLSGFHSILLYFAIGALQAGFCDYCLKRSKGSSINSNTWLLFLVAWPAIYVVAVYLTLTGGFKNV